MTTNNSSPFDEAPMSVAQVAAVIVTVLLSALDGYDVLSVSFVAPAISHGWGIGKADLGLVLSSSLVGMALGSLLLAPLADVFGRRPVVFAGVVFMAAGSFLSAYCHSVAELSVCRVLTGLGIGVLVAVINSLAAEFANARRRSLAVAAMAIGYPLGAVAGGLAAANLLRHQGWPAVFLVGAAAAAVMLLVVGVWLPESPSFLTVRRPARALERLNAVLARCRKPILATLPDVPPEPRASYRALFAPGMAATTLRVTVVNLLVATAAYYVLSWLPQMVADAGFPPSTASLVSAISSLTGVVAGLALGALAAFTGPARLAAGAMIGLGLALGAFGFAPPSLPLLMFAAAACGFFLFGGTAVFYATLAITFTPAARASGTGFVIGVGRVASAVGPYLAGWMFAAGLSRGQVSLAFALSALVGGLLLATARPSSPALQGVKTPA